MVSAVENQKSSSGGRQEEKAIFREDVVMEHSSTCFIANTVHTGLVIAIEGGQVNIGTCLVLRVVCMISSEAVMDDERGEANLKCISKDKTTSS